LAENESVSDKSLTLDPATAKALGIDLPAQVLALADEVIE